MSLDLHTKNGTGRALRGIRAAGDGTYFATVWDVRAHVPIRPRSRHRIRVLGTNVSGFAVGTHYTVQHGADLVVLETTELDPAEVRTTYLLGWVMAPLALLAPLAVSAIVIAQVGLDEMSTFGRGVAILGPLTWLSLGYGTLGDWLDKRLGKLSSGAGRDT